VNTRMVAVSRQIGTGGERIARCVAQTLNFQYFDEEVIGRAAEEAGVTIEAMNEADRAPTLRQRMLDALTASRAVTAIGWFDPTPILVNPLYTSTHFRDLIHEVLRELANEGDAVVLGHGAQVVLKDRWDTVKVLISGSVSVRAIRLRESGAAADEPAAHRLIADSDRERADYFERFHAVAWLHPANYDICLNTDHLSVQQAVDLICEAARQR